MPETTKKSSDPVYLLAKLKEFKPDVYRHIIGLIRSMIQK